jgi:hypothetical protein
MTSDVPPFLADFLGRFNRRSDTQYIASPCPKCGCNGDKVEIKYDLHYYRCLACRVKWHDYKDRPAYRADVERYWEANK